MLLEDSVFSDAEADAFGRLLGRAASARSGWPGGVRLKSIPIEPYVSKARMLPAPGMNPMPWLLQPQPRLQINLRARSADGGHEASRKRLLDAQREIAVVLSEGIPFLTRYFQGDIDCKTEFVGSDRDATLDLILAITLLEC
jgi:hypothetical protein